MSHELIRITAVWGYCRTKTRYHLKVPGQSVNIKVGAFPPSSCSQEMNLELLMGREAASPHLKPLSGLANLCARGSPQALPPQGQDTVGKMVNSYGS